MRRFAFIAAAVVFVLGACTRLDDSHGYVPDDALLSEVVVGLDTKETVGRILGQPGTSGIVDDEGWYYVRSEFRRFLWRAPVETDREVVAITFADGERVSNIERFGLENGRVVTLSRRVTDSNTRGIGFLRQLFSNIGNLNAGDLLQE